MKVVPACRGQSRGPVTLFPSQNGWQEDVALELWVDVARQPVSVRLAGTLDGSTAVNLVAVVEELISEGVREFDLQTAGLRVVGPEGAGALEALELLVRRADDERRDLYRLRGGGPVRVGRGLHSRALRSSPHRGE